MARNNGIEEKMMIIEADWLDDDFVAAYFSGKNEALLTALNENELPGLCNYDERWQGRRCKGSLCEVHVFCPEGAKVNRVKLEV